MRTCVYIIIQVHKDFWRSPVPTVQKQIQAMPGAQQCPLKFLISPRMEILQPLLAPIPVFDHPHFFFS